MNTTNPPPSESVTIADAAIRLGVSVRTVQRRVASGQLESEPGPGGSVRVRLRASQVSPETSSAVVVRDALSAALTRYETSLDALDRSKTRWVATASVAVGVAGVAATLATALAVRTSELDRRAEAAEEGRARVTLSLVTAKSALADSERRIGDLRVEVFEGDKVSAELRDQLRQVTAERRQLAANLALLEAERDRLACELDQAEADLAWASLVSAPVRHLSLDTRDR